MLVERCRKFQKDNIIRDQPGWVGQWTALGIRDCLNLPENRS
jgi:hypothetical protein